MEFKDRLKELRIKSDISAVELAKRLDKSESAIRMWDSGKNKPDADTLIILSGIFECSIDYLLGCTEGRNFQEEWELSQAQANDEDISHLGIGIYKRFKDYMNHIDKINAWYGGYKLSKFSYGENLYNHFTGITSARRDALEPFENMRGSRQYDAEVKAKIIKQLLRDIKEADNSGEFIETLLKDMEK